MIRKLIAFSARNRMLVLLGVAAVAAIAAYLLREIPLDALPDLSDSQVIVYSRWDRSPDIVEDQVTYPIITALLGAPRVKAIRGFSDFGFSYVYVVFQDGTDLYWARSRVLEYLSKIQSRLPEGVQTELGPDATGVGWVYQYALLDRSGTHSLDELRSFQDWNLRYALQSVPGVAEVAAVGGFVKQYQITVDPNRLSAYNLPIDQVVEAVRRSNNEVGGRLLEWSGREYMVRGRGYARSLADFEQIVLKVGPGGVPVLLRDVGKVDLGPEIRRDVRGLLRGGREVALLADAGEHEEGIPSEPVRAGDVGVEPVAHDKRVPGAGAIARRFEQRRMRLPDDRRCRALGGLHRREQGACSRPQAVGLREGSVRVRGDELRAALDEQRGPFQLRVRDLSVEADDNQVRVLGVPVEELDPHGGQCLPETSLSDDEGSRARALREHRGGRRCGGDDLCR